MNVLKQSTAVTIKLGPFVDATDGVTAETALTITQADVRLAKNGLDIAQKTDTTSATHDELGYYDVPLDTTDTNTVGTLRVMVSESGALPVFRDFQVIEEAVYDALFGSGAVGPLLSTSTGSGLSAIPWNASWDAEVESECTEALNAYDPPTRAELTSDINSLNDLDAAGIQAAVGLATANLDTQLGAIATAADGAAAEAIATYTEVTNLATDIGANGAGLTAIPWNASWDAEVESECAEAITAATVLKADVAYTVTTVNGTLATTFAS